MHPLSACTSSATATSLPRFWRITFADLIALWGEEQAEQMLAAMQRSFEGQEPEVGWIYDARDLRDLEQ